jgi:hypothetical protein
VRGLCVSRTGLRVCSTRAALTGRIEEIQR